MTPPLRLATLADLDAVMTLEEAGFAAGIVEERSVFARRIEAFPEGFLLAGNPPWGYLCAELWRSWSPNDSERFELGHDLQRYLDRDGETLYLASMTVAPAYRGGGLGRALFRAGLADLKRRFPRLRQAVLIVNEVWQGARAIYTAEGFVEVERLRGFFCAEGEPPCDAIVMTKALARSLSDLGAFF